MRKLVLVAHNLRSAHNVGSLLRTCEGLGVEKVILSGYTPYPLIPGDTRLPHLAAKITMQIAKTALGAEKSIAFEHAADIESAIRILQEEGYLIAALEQTSGSVALPGFMPPERLAVVVGREVEGLEADVLELCDTAIEIPMLGKKESFNVVQAAAMALYHCRFMS